ncbi:MAG: thiamine diphosphokinase [Ignavibacteria bacterium]
MMKSAIIYCNGSPIKKVIFQKIKTKYNADLIAADGGTNSIHKIGELPKFIIGDLDSVNTKILKFYRNNNVKIIKLSRQSDTDLEKALKLCKRLHYNKIFVVGFSGKRFDHTLSNISNALKFVSDFQIVMVDNNSTLQFVTGKSSFKSEKGELISILCFDPQVKITTENLRYKLNDEHLMFGRRESTSNVSTKENFSLIVKNGFAVLIRSTKNFLKYD